ncbi:hypothetical protein [Hymenobacter koreensis]|uniref:Uncharacterized protein n=1 Tax=Hymenobacter koreensis TaxID=1084523 RepID=A0ABP8IVK1_9BACT
MKLATLLLLLLFSATTLPARAALSDDTTKPNPKKETKEQKEVKPEKTRVRLFAPRKKELSYVRAMRRNEVLR